MTDLNTVMAWKAQLDRWWEEKSKEFLRMRQELTAFETFGARQCQGVNRYEPDRPKTKPKTVVDQLSKELPRLPMGWQTTETAEVNEAFERDLAGARRAMADELKYPPFTAKPETRNLTYEMLEKSKDVWKEAEEKNIPAIIPNHVWEKHFADTRRILSSYFFNKREPAMSQTFNYEQTVKYPFGFEDSRSASKSVAAVDESADTLTLPKLMKCPVCGTNPGRCEKPLTSEETTCFRCGKALEEL